MLSQTSGLSVIPGSGRCVWTCVQGEVDKVDVADLQLESLIIPAIWDGYVGRKGQWSSSELEMGRNELLCGFLGQIPTCVQSVAHLCLGLLLVLAQGLKGKAAR